VEIGTRVESIIAAAEAAAAEVGREARADAARTREDALAASRKHVEAVGAAVAGLLERIGELDEAVADLRASATRIATDAKTLDTSMGELYDAASARSAAPGAATEPVPQPVAAPAGAGASPLAAAPAEAAEAAPAREQAVAQARVANGDAGTPLAATPAAAGADIDSARLIALNMALNGDSRADAERYLAENFQLADGAALIEEVFAAVEA
jgi:TolA-binding protein